MPMRVYSSVAVRLTVFVLVAAACAHARPRSLFHPARYTTTIEERIAGCEMGTCAGRAADSTVWLELRADRTATLGWTKTGCNLVVSGGKGPIVMPNDLTLEWLCGAHPDYEHPDFIDLKGTKQLDGRWSPDGTLAFDGFSLACKPDARAAIACGIASGAWEDSIDFVAQFPQPPVLYFDDAGLRVSLRRPGFGAGYQVDVMYPPR
jgi:hypothetical protein